ncbi:toll/interleukin-1 receptor domain-containing protein [Massilia sp. GCM10023247]|uniref:toll/interleukin-1 receptor domain-containing protein n=1 Tax=Massilia sp. GCM10023247 TaxID=3252643 RepID=UPI00361CE55F
MTPPVVFISYSHDSQEHKQWVLDLATRLRSSGVDAILDQWDLGPGSDLPHFMEQSLARASRVLMICTERYVEKANGSKGGVGYEKMIVTGDLLKSIDSNRVIPIVRQAGTVHLPTFLASKFYIDLSTDDLFESGMDQLLRALLNAPLFVKPPLGADPFKVVTGTAEPSIPTPVNQLLEAISKLYERSTENGALPIMMVKRELKTSKLFFDHALDQAEELGYVSCDSGREDMWVTESGRAALVRLATK